MAQAALLKILAAVQWMAAAMKVPLQLPKVYLELLESQVLEHLRSLLEEAPGQHSRDLVMSLYALCLRIAK